MMRDAGRRMSRFTFVIVVLCMTVLCPPVVWAEGFPPSISKSVIDTQNLLKVDEKKEFTKVAADLAQTYKLLIITDPKPLTLTQYAQQLPSKFTINDTTMVIVVSFNDKKIAAVSGKYFTERGITEEVVTRKADNFFTPYAKQGAVMKGVLSFVQSIDTDVKDAKPTEIVAQTAAANAPQNVEAFPVWLLAGLALVAVFGIGLIIAFTLRKRTLKEIDETDEWRIRTSEQLNLFTVDPSWKKEPGRIKEKYLAILTSLDDLKKDAIVDVELILADAEEMASQFRFRRSRDILTEARGKLMHIESDLEKLHIRLENLKETLQDVSSFKEETNDMRQKVERRFSELKIQYNVSFHTLKERLNQLDRETGEIKESEEKGDFHVARDLLQQVRDNLIEMSEELEKMPLIRQAIMKDIDQEIRQLDEDAKEMVTGGYTSGEEFFLARLIKIRGKAEILPQLFEEGKIEETEEQIGKVREDIEAVYQTMEEIVTSRHRYRQYMTELPHYVMVLRQDEQFLAEELEDLAQRYQVEEGEAFRYYQQIPVLVADAEDALEQIAAAEVPEAYERHSQMLTQVAERVTEIMERRELIMKELNEFRKGETAALAEVKDLRASVARVEQQLKRLYLPAIPSYVADSLHHCRQAIASVEGALAESPLNIQKAEMLLKQAKGQVENALEQAAEMVRDVRETEDKVQRTNRFRRKDPEIGKLLKASETAFRAVRYEEASELAAQAYDLAVERYGLD
ncbi:septation ring formation regulator EzrA [Aneurinibacillus soli]|uniref:Septation ring formation regulator EzrA n=1 Tax=Aneurinibacillus soli TaxID=1500254 RepID=A0A0U5AZX9_9BACL|nr:septation ring formation regulator EzrA [Aneurinibacillus soli]PYE59702.1 septation ring formation regulator EzrA [Aneurinibacillus soli]BAU29297.1 Septation ring formation regulator EzrA [Aneurinibacillus soli]